MTKRKKTIIIALTIAVILLLTVALILTLTFASEKLVGVFYYDGEKGEYKLTLTEDRTFTLVIGEETLTGKYKLKGDKLTLSCKIYDNEVRIAAVVKEEDVIFSYGNERDMVFIPYVEYTFTYTVEDKTYCTLTEVGGRHARRPVDPVKDGFDFDGWFVGNDFKTRYEFGKEVVSCDTTLYGRFIEKEPVVINTLTLIVGERGELIGGVSEISVPVPMGESVTLTKPYPLSEVDAFLGWFDEEGKKVSGEYGNETITLEGDVTLFARWVEAYAFSETGNGVTIAAGPELDLLSVAILPSKFGEKNVVKLSSLGAAPSLQTIVIPLNVTEIASGAFDGCSALNEIEVAEENSAFKSYNGILYDADDVLIYYPRGRKDEKVVLDEATKAIGRKAFAGCSVGSVEVNAAVTEIGMSAFSESGLTKITFPSDGKLTKVGDYAFEKTKISEIILPHGTAIIGSRAFYLCEELVRISADCVTDLAFEALAGTSSLTEFSLPSLRTIGVSALENSGIKEIVIPSSVKSIGERAFYGSALTRVEFAGVGAAAISAYAFAECAALTEVKFTDDSALEAILGHAFENSGLRRLTLPPKLRYLDESCFFGAPLSEVELTKSYDGKLDAFLSSAPLERIITDNCDYFDDVDGVLFDRSGALVFYPLGRKDEEYVVPASATRVSAGVFNGNSYLREISFQTGCKITAIEEGTFENCTQLFSVSLPSEIAVIGARAFAGCTALKEISLKAREIGESAFEGSGLTAVSLPSSLESLGSSAFKNSENLIQVTFCDCKLDKIPAFAFANCTSLQEIDLCESVKEIGVSAFDSCGLTEINLAFVEKIDKRAFAGSKLKSISSVKATLGSEAFLNCTELVECDLSGVQKIEAAVFKGCLLLSKICLTKITNLGESAFEGCASLEDVGVSGGDLFSIPMRAFKGCAGLINVTLNEGIKTIGDEAFSGCSLLSEIKLPDSLQVIKSGAFEGCAQAELVVPKSVALIERDAFKDAKGVSVEEENENLIITDGLLYEKSGDKAEVLRYPVGSLSSEINVPNGVTKISKEALIGAEIKQISIPSSVTTIEEFALKDSAIEEIDFEDSCDISEIGAGAFSGCKIKEFNVPASVTMIADSVFENCIELRSVTFVGSSLLYIGKRAFSGSGLTEIKIPSSVLGIAEAAFLNCKSLVKVNLPNNSISIISESLFEGCTSLKNITLPSGLKKIGSRAFFGCVSIPTLTVPSGVTVDSMAFSGWTKNQTLKVHSSDIANWQHDWNKDCAADINYY